LYSLIISFNSAGIEIKIRTFGLLSFIIDIFCNQMIYNDIKGSFIPIKITQICTKKYSKKKGFKP
jgi:hypothetical protein